MKEMRSWKDEVILPADKGNATVVRRGTVRYYRYSAIPPPIPKDNSYLGSQSNPGTREI